jgi:hypothetical protein
MVSIEGALPYNSAVAVAAQKVLALQGLNYMYMKNSVEFASIPWADMEEY